MVTPSGAGNPYTAYSVSWNLTQRCNLECAHCYMSASAGADTRSELTTDECRRVIDEIATVNPNVFLILTGGEPLLRKDIWDIAAHASEKRFTTVLGTNGVLLREREAKLMKERGVLGASISLDSTDPQKHDRFRRLPNAWDGAVRATRVLNDAGLDFSLHMSVTDWNVDEVPAMVDLAKELGAKVLNFFFLVRTGRGRDLTDIDAAAYERILTWLAKAQGVGAGPPSFVQRLLGRAPAAPEPSPFEDPWSTPVGRADGLLIRAKCAPHFRRIIWELNPASPLLRNYAHGSCPAGKYYCRITPAGDVTPCPYMPVAAGNLRSASFADLWRSAPVFDDLREPKLGGRCGACEFSKVCGGRCRAYATYGDYLAEDPACGYQPGAHGGQVIDLPATMTFGLPVSEELTWEPAARQRLDAIPSFARGMVVKAVEAYARGRGQTVITAALLAEVRSTWGARFRRVNERVARRFRDAARGYLVYGIVYYVGGLYMLWHGVGVVGSMEGRRISALVFWALAGLVPMLLIPYLIARPRAPFERWILTRRDFTRVVALFLAFRAYKVGQVILHHHGGSVPAPWGGSITFQAGAAIFTVVTLGALVLVAWAAWAPERAGEAREPASPDNAREPASPNTHA